MELYIVRHGQTDYNLRGIVQGRGINSSLNETGRKQAAALFNSYKDVAFDHLFLSTLQRTHQTVAPFIERGLSHSFHPELDEIDWGVFEGIENRPDMHERYLYIIEQWRQGDLDLKIDGGESAADLQARMISFTEQLKDRTGQRLLVCSHGRSIRALLCCLTGKDMALMDDFPHQNTTVYKLNGQLGALEMELFNNTDHLNDAI